MKCQCKVKKGDETVVAHFETVAEQVITNDERCFVSAEEKEKWNNMSDNVSKEKVECKHIIASSAELGERSGFVAHENNVYVGGSVFMAPKDQCPTINGFGAQGGNIYLPASKALVGLTKNGPQVDEDGKQSDSGCRTIAFIGRVTDEDKMNDQESVHIGSKVCRTYLYCKNSYPLVVTDRLIKDGEQSETGYIETISPVATQEWVMDMLTSLGLLGGHEDKTEYINAPANAGSAFNMAMSESWTLINGYKWTLSATGAVSFTKSSVFWNSYVPLFQAGGWNEIYFKNTNTSYTNNAYVLFKTDQYAYCIEPQGTRYVLFTVHRDGSREFERQYTLASPLVKGKLTRLKYDETNKAFVFSEIDSENNETRRISISEYAFQGFPEFSSRQVCLGLVCCINQSANKMITVVDRPVGFSPELYTVASEEELNSAVIRNRDVIREAKTMELLGLARKK